jgi:cysteine desulfurase
LDRHGEAERIRIAALRDQLADRLKAIPSFRLSTPSPAGHPGTLHARFEGVDGLDLLTRLQPEIAASTGSACASGQAGSSHVLAAIGLTRSVAGECLRFSVGRFTTVEEIEKAAVLIKDTISEVHAL